MKLSVLLFIAGLFGALGVLLFLVAFGTDYWLQATETCPSVRNSTDSIPAEKGDIIVPSHRAGAIFHHEGFFWRCWFNEAVVDDNIWKFWFTNQPPLKYCMHAYLLPFPLTTDSYNSTTYETAIIYRGFWSVFMMLGIIAVTVGGFIIICAVPFPNHKLYKAGGGLFLSAGILFTVLVIMYVIWIETVIDIQEYIQKQRIQLCPDFTLNIQYGWSFIIAAIGIFFSLFSGLLFLLAGHAIHIHYD
ncbi:transmembrane protein 182 isoform X1 [Stegostoma tigrinum]|uniref:transmembrane protein 182 isoform X1 n=2 Tax=Stegostoma tigrinum TaxID=3053191 RepID=UPI00202B0583|nr:transmembrane protein 182 isoform X1 [Stegostoma tigrinum]